MKVNYVDVSEYIGRWMKYFAEPSCFSLRVDCKIDYSFYFNVSISFLHGHFQFISPHSSPAFYLTLWMKRVVKGRKSSLVEIRFSIILILSSSNLKTVFVALKELHFSALDIVSWDFGFILSSYSAVSDTSSVNGRETSDRERNMN